MRTSIGYHTFVKSMLLTQEEATDLLNDFKKYRDTTGLIQIIRLKKSDNDRFGRHCSIVYPNQEMGISWRIRFSDRGFYKNGDIMSCSIKATINPKILVGEKTYIVAANASCLEEVEKKFNQEAKKISPILKQFHDYSMNRIDYCINFDVRELKFERPFELRDVASALQFNCPPEITERLPELIMELIKQGDIPRHFSNMSQDVFQFYLKSKSVVVNCYWKHGDLSKNFSDCQDLNASYNIIRFEVQFRYPKAHAAAAKIIKEQTRYKKIYEERAKDLAEKFEKYDWFILSEMYNGSDKEEANKLWEEYLEASKSVSEIVRLQEDGVIKNMLSDEKCTETIENYFYEIIKPGDYYTFSGAKKIIETKVSGWEKAIRLLDTLKLISKYNGISKAKATLSKTDLENFRRSLRELAHLGINPVTIPDEWGIKYIPNLLRNYYMKLEEERKEAQDQELLLQMFRDDKKERKKDKKHRKKSH